MGFSSSNDSVPSAQWAALSPDARRLLSKMSPADRLVLLGADSSPKKSAATASSPKGKEYRRGLFRHFSSDSVPVASRRTSTTTTSKSIEFVMECPIETPNFNPDETEHSGGDDNENPVMVDPVSTTPRRQVRRHVSTDGIPLNIGGGGKDNHAPVASLSPSPRSSRKESKRGVRRHVSSDGSDIFSSSTSSPRNSPRKDSKRGVRRHVSADGTIVRKEKGSAEFGIECEKVDNKKKTRKSKSSSKKLDDDIDSGSYKNFR